MNQGIRPATFFFSAIILSLSFASCEKEEPPLPRTISIQGETMGTTYSVRIVEKNSGPIDETRQNLIAEKIQEELDQVNGRFSTWLSDSEISQINQSKAGVPIPVSQEMKYLLDISKNLNIESGGAFDPTIGPLIELWGFGKKERGEIPTAQEIRFARSISGMQHLKIDETFITKDVDTVTINLSAIAKGYGVDRVAERLLLLGLESFMVEVGGEVRTSGKTARETGWKIGIENPDPESRSLFGSIEIESGSVATSGDYRNFIAAKENRLSHILDPATGRPVNQGVVSATVTGPDCTTSDALATTLMVLPPEKGLQLIEKNRGYEALLLVIPAGTHRITERKSSGFRFTRM